jgi:hypothetical protein
MARKNNKDDENERLYNENRELKKLNRSLLKQLKKKSKGKHRGYQVDIHDEKDEEEFIEIKNLCPSCGKSNLREMNLGPKRIKICDLCKFRSKAYD